ncbi:MAG: hypothetical protein HC797_07825 [Anaerolineales bacterium]|nr:hypothetical protein [Anaerolineales bacterium]
MVKKFATASAKILRRTLFLVLLSSFLFACSSQPTPQIQIVTINYSPFTELWIDEVYACANDLSLALKISSEDPDIYVQIGEPEILLDHAYQIGEEEIVVVVNRQSEIQNLSLNEIQSIFANGENVWVYAEREDMQKVFDQFVMEGRSASSFARIAPNPRVMLEVLKFESNAIGFIPKSFMDESLKEIYSAGSFPVLAITKSEPQWAVKSLLGCLQKKLKVNCK